MHTVAILKIVNNCDIFVINFQSKNNWDINAINYLFDFDNYSTICITIWCNKLKHKLYYDNYAYNKYVNRYFRHEIILMGRNNTELLVWTHDGRWTTIWGVLATTSPGDTDDLPVEELPPAAADESCCMRWSSSVTCCSTTDRNTGKLLLVTAPPPQAQKHAILLGSCLHVYYKTVGLGMFAEII